MTRRGAELDSLAAELAERALALARAATEAAAAQHQVRLSIDDRREAPDPFIYDLLLSGGGDEPDLLRHVDIMGMDLAIPAVHLVLVGGWRSLALPAAEGDAYRDVILDLVRECGLEDRVRVTGFLPEHEVSALLYAADVVCLPFTYGISLKSGTLLAALAHGRSVVGTLGAQADALEPVVHVPPRDAHALAEAIIGLLSDRERRNGLALAGTRLAQAFTWPAIAAQHLSLSAKLL